MKSICSVIVLAGFCCTSSLAGAFTTTCTSTSEQSVSLESPTSAIASVVCPQFSPPSGYAITGVQLRGLAGGGPFPTAGTITVRNNQSSSFGPWNGFGLVNYELAYLDFPGMSASPQPFPVFFAAPLSFAAGETIVAPVSTAFNWPLVLTVSDSASLSAYAGSGTITSRVTGNAIVLAGLSDFSVLDYSFTVNPAPSIIYTYEASGIPEPASVTYVALAAAAAGLWAARRRQSR